ncbi:MAG: DoxX family protein [Chlamydiota bacterium]
MQTSQVILSFLARFFVGIVFIFFAVNKIFDWQDTERIFTTAICDWHTYVSYWVTLQDFCSSALSYTPTIAMVCTGLELIGGLMLVFGWQIRLGAFLLVLVFLPTIILFHPFWFLDGTTREISFNLFMRELAILGGLFAFLAYVTQKGKAPAPKK